MDTRRSFLAAFAVALSLFAAKAQASFELLLMLDYGDKRIKRFDPDTGTYMGQFGANKLVNPQRIAFGPNPGELLVTDVIDSLNRFSVIHVFDYNTGALKRQTFNQNVYLAGGIQRDTDGTYYLAELTGSLNVRFIRWNSTLTSILSTQSLSLSPGQETAISQVDIAINPTTVVATLATGVAVLNKNTLATSYSAWPAGVAPSSAFFAQEYGQNLYTSRLESGTSNALYDQNGARITNFFPNLKSCWGSARGHVNYYLSGYDTSNVAQIFGINPAAGGIKIGSFGAGNIVNPGDMVVVVAPEPGSLIALTAGSLAILARARSRRK